MSPHATTLFDRFAARPSVRSGRAPGRPQDRSQGRPSERSQSRRTSRLHRGVAAVAATGCLAAVSVVGGAAPADAFTSAHDAIGSTRSMTAVNGGVLARGWAGDPDAPGANTRVVGLLDGRNTVAVLTTSISMPAVTKAHDVGPTPGYALRIPVPAGKHTVCVVARNVGPGLDKVLNCTLFPLSRRVTSAKIARHSPNGAIVHGWAARHTAHFGGWAADPDDLARATVVTLYVDGVATATAPGSAYPWPRPAGAGYRSAFDFSAHVSTGAHLGCLWATNVGIGNNTFLGCRAVDTRSHQTLTNPAPATIGTKVVAEAKKHIGQSYVWGATGPKSFDCSGLVVYSYGKFGYTTPRVSSDQFAAARVIPAAKARPGDLVFYHDSTGDVYHVGIYTGPAMTVAAIDTAEGVDYQRVWDPTWATYGSFSHT